MRDSFIPISALEHFAYCERQWGLIHVEQFFADNDDTVRGHHVHETVDTLSSARRGEQRVEHHLPVWSESLGLFGYCDSVEVAGDRVVPVEYKSGRRFEHPAEVQLCAQALCLEEMLGTTVPTGVIYLAGTRTRHEVDLGSPLRADVSRVVRQLRESGGQSLLAVPANDPRCRACSLKDGCLPELAANPHRVAGLSALTWR